MCLMDIRLLGGFVSAAGSDALATGTGSAFGSGGLRGIIKEAIKADKNR